MDEMKTTASVITDADVQDAREMADNLKMLPQEVRRKIQYIIEGAKLVADHTPPGNQGGAA